MHLADGVLSMPVALATYGVSLGAMAYAAKKTREEDIPKISLMAATFFAVSLISIPVPPTSVHPLLAGLIGIILGAQAPLAFFVALLLQALLFKHGGLSSLGANTLMLTLPAYLSYFLYRKLRIENKVLRAGLIGGISVLTTVVILVSLLAITDQRFAQGDYSLIKIAALSHLPIVAIEAVITGFAVSFIEKNKADWIN